jgi:serine O-acetyltransferase
VSNICEDLKRYFSEDASLVNKIKTVLLTQGIWALIIFRTGSWCHHHKKTHWYFILCSPFLTVAQKIIEILTGIQIPFSAQIGKGFYIGHFGNIILEGQVVIGEYCEYFTRGYCWASRTGRKTAQPCYW